MKSFQQVVIAIAALSLIGCASWMAPSEKDMAQVPVVRFGSTAPAGKEFVVMYPAGTPLPVVASVGGTLMDQGDKATLRVTLKQNVYVYKRWVSFDGKNWKYARHAVKGKFDIKLPGTENGSNAGALGLEFNTK